MRRDSNEPDSHTFEKSLAVDILRALFRITMHATVDLDSHSKRLAIEIKHEFSNRVLPPELQIQATAVA